MKTSKACFRGGSNRRRLLLMLACIAGLLQWNLWSDVQAGTGPPPDGSLDSGFGTGGRVTSSFTSQVGINAIAIQQDGKIVAVGKLNQQFQVQFAVARYNANGSLDASFGTGGRVVTSVKGLDDEPFAVAIQSDGKIVVGGQAVFQQQILFALVRYNSNGTPDAGFGAGGIVVTGFNGQDTVSGLAIQQDGKIIAGGTSGPPASSVFAMARYNTNGSLDPGFGAGGKATTAFTQPFQGGAFVNGIALQQDGKIVAAGGLFSQVKGSTFAVARYNTNGGLDQGFGTAGQITTSFPGTSFAGAVAIQPDGKILTAGNSSIANAQPPQFALVRYNPNGTLDGGFGSGGQVTTSFSGLASGFAVAIQSDGKPVVAGTMSVSNSQSVFALARYNLNGSLDNSFGAAGEVTTSFTGSSDGVRAMAIQADGRIVAGGSAFTNFALARYNSLSFDTCMANQAGTVVFSANTRTGGYRLNTCNGSVLTGTGTLRQVGSVLTLTDFRPDRRVSVAILTNQLTARATIYVLVTPGVWQLYTINATATQLGICSCANN